VELIKAEDIVKADLAAVTASAAEKRGGHGMLGGGGWELNREPEPPAA
jgi:hypothetical protein